MELKILTLNAWGLHLKAKFVEERLRAIGKAIQSYDVVCLQEIWSRDDYDDLVYRVSSKLPYSHHFRSSIIGSGLCIFSKYPIVSANSYQYRVTEGIRKFYTGEAFAGKGVLCCKVETPQGIVAVFTTHLCEYRRESNMVDLMQFVWCIQGNHPVIICGDFNTNDRHTCYQLMTKCLGMKDVYSDEPWVNTCDVPGNPFTKEPQKAQRIDFIFYSDEFCGDQQLILKSRALALSGNIPGRDYPYSDHEGIEAVFNLVKTDENFLSPPRREMSDDVLNILQKVSTDINETMSTLYSVDVHKHGWNVILCLVLSLIVIYLLLSTVNELLHTYHLQWLTMPIMAITGAILLLIFFILMNETHQYSGMQANIEEINVILQYKKYRNCDAFI